MKWSKYNLFIENEKKLIYSYLSGSLLELDDESFDKLKEIYCHAEDIAKIDEEFYHILVDKKFLVKSDEEEYQKIKFIRQKARFNNNRLSLTLVPTMACNFGCPYCFEKNQDDYRVMDKRTIDSLLKFIERHSDKKIDISWYGGEPLLAFKKIREISEEIIKRNIKFRAFIVTNGYLLNEEIIKSLASLNINQVQITIDGLEKTHNQRRYLKNGMPTFDTIIKNVVSLFEHSENTRVAIRVNIDKTNSEEFDKLCEYINSKIQDASRLYIYPEFVVDYADAGSCKSTDCITSREKKAEFILDNIASASSLSNYKFPNVVTGSCTMRALNSYLIVPNGDMYKCWNVIGNKEYKTGNINDFDDTDLGILAKCMTEADSLEDESCKNCSSFPVCNGGCPYLRLRNLHENENYDLCYEFKNNLNNYLTKYANQKEQLF